MTLKISNLEGLGAFELTVFNHLTILKVELKLFVRPGDVEQGLAFDGPCIRYSCYCYLSSWQ